jgi:hypothetical protein
MKMGEAHRTRSSWRTDAPCSNRNGGPNTKKNPPNIFSAQSLLIIAYWCTDPPCANSISAPKKKHPASPQSKQSGRLSLQSSELGLPNPLTRR